MGIELLLKNFARSIFETGSLSRVRAMVAWREAMAEARFVEIAAQRFGLGYLIPSNFRLTLGGNGATTLFILGSGASVERLGESEWSKIRANVSIGINSWVLHSFVPNAYAYEPVAPGPGHAQLMSLLARPDIIDRSPWVLFLKPRTQVEEEQLRQIPEPLLRKTLLYGRFQPATRRLSNLGPDLLWLLKRCSSAGRPVLPDSGASIVRMAALGILMEFKEIVFVGVDLNDSAYFWEDTSSHLERNGLTQFRHLQTRGEHETMRPNNRAFVVAEMIEALQECGAVAGTRMFVESPASLLAGFLDVYDWNVSYKA